MRILRLVLKGLCLPMACAFGLVGSTLAQSNPIVVENQQPGTSQWQIPYGAAATDIGGQIKGYGSPASVNKGQNITFYVSTNPAQTYTIDVYRMGWYQGLGARLMQHVGPLNGVRQPTCPTDATTGMIECRWAQAYTLATQASWTSGIYLALLTNAQGFQNYIVFAVRDDSRVAPLLYQQAVTTYQAYNNYPNDNATGKSLYAFNSYGATTITGAKNAAKVSFDRPYLGDGTGTDFSQSFLSWEYPFIRWMEQSGYDVTYSTDVETHTNGGRLLNYRGLLSVGHDEYWSKAMYDAVIAARDAGVNLGFFGADAIGWQVRFESSSTGVPNRVIVCYRDSTIDPITDPTLKTVQWRDQPLNRPEQTLMGVQYTAQVPYNSVIGGYASYVVTNSGNWVYAGTGFRNGDSVPGIVGYEADRLFSEYPPPNAVTGTYTQLSNSPLGNGGPSDFSNSTVYQAPSGAWVFAAGTVGWSSALDGGSFVDSRIQRTTANILNRFIAPRGDFMLSASPASQSVSRGGATSYSVNINPTGGFNGQVNLSVTGLPAGANGSFNPNPATTSATFSVTTSASTPTGTYTLTITGTSGTLTHNTTVSLVVNAAVDFTLSASPSSQTVLTGGSTSYGITITSMGGFAGQVTLGLSGLPGGANASFAPNPATTSSTLSVTTSTSTPPGGYTLTVTGVSGSLSHSIAITLVVSPPPDFTLSASPSSQTVTRGSPTSYTVTISPIGGFTGQVNLSVSGLPAGANGSFSPNPTTTSSTLSVTTSTSTPLGSYTLTITGVSGTLTHTTTVTLTVAAAQTTVTYDNAVSSGFQFGVITITTPAFTVGSGTNRAAMIMVGMSANNATNITARLGGINGTLVPGSDSGTTATIRTLIFQVINPPSGSQTATVSWTGTMNADVGVITVSGADQSTPCTNGTFAASNADAVATIAVTINSNPGDLTASVGLTLNQWVAPFTNQILKWGVDSTVVAGDIGPGTGTTTHMWSDQWPNGTHSVSGANFKAAAVASPDFTLSASPLSQTVARGSAASYSVSISPTGGFNGQVNLSISGLPSGANGSFTPNPATASSSLLVTTSTSTPLSSYTLTITGVSSTLTHTANVTLVVSLPDFTLSASPPSRTVSPSGSTSYGITVTQISGFTGQVNLSVSGLPTGANGSFSPNPTTTSSTLSVTTSTSTPLGSYTLTITGVSGTLTHTTTVTLTVAAAQTTVTYDNAVSSGFQFGVITITTPAFTVGSGTNRAAMIMVGMSANNATNITARLGGINGTLVPGSDSGTTATIRTLIFQVINPPSGSQTATVSWTGAMNADVGVITVSGADQSTPCTNGTFTATNSTPDATTSVTISSNSGDLTASIGYTTDGWATPATNQTAKWGPDSGAVGGDIGAGTGTTTHTWTDVWPLETHSVSGANFKAGTF